MSLLRCALKPYQPTESFEVSRGGGAIRNANGIRRAINLPRFPTGAERRLPPLHSPTPLFPTSPESHTLLPNRLPDRETLMTKAPSSRTPTRIARVNIRTTEDLHRQLAKLAKEDRRSLSSFIESVLEDYVAAAGKKRAKRR